MARVQSREEQSGNVGRGGWGIDCSQRHVGCPARPYAVISDDDMRMQTILILSHRRGFEADHVIDAIRRRGFPVMRFNADLDVPGTAINIDLTTSPPRLALTCDGRTIAGDDVAVAWFQQPPDKPIKTEADREALQRLSWTTAYYSFCDRLTCQWLNAPRRVREASCKPAQLALAQEIGLAVPRTLVTNDTTRLRQFLRSCNDGVVVKNLNTPWYVDRSGQTLAAFTQRLSVTALDDPLAVEFAPVIYQEFIDRTEDIRVVVIGNSVFAAVTHPTTDDARVDIRRTPLHETRYHATTLSASLERLLLQLMKRLDLGYGAIDLAVARDGKAYFLEVNCTGTFLWIERLAGLPITDAIVDYLIAHLAR